jgi:hypothetical protein
LERLGALEEYASLLPDKFFIDQLEEVRLLRNTISHTGNTSDKDNILQKFIDRLLNTHRWIEGIEQWQKAKANTTH